MERDIKSDFLEIYKEAEKYRDLPLLEDEFKKNKIISISGTMCKARIYALPTSDNGPDDFFAVLDLDGKLVRCNDQNVINETGALLSKDISKLYENLRILMRQINGLKGSD